MLAVSFNEMAFEASFLPITIIVLVLGHGLNIGLAMIAMFAHGVRLNMLEFGSNLGMQWAGYPFRPFAQRTTDITHPKQPSIARVFQKGNP